MDRTRHAHAVCTCIHGWASRHPANRELLALLYPSMADVETDLQAKCAFLCARRPAALCRQVGTRAEGEPSSYSRSPPEHPLPPALRKWRWRRCLLDVLVEHARWTSALGGRDAPKDGRGSRCVVSPPWRLVVARWVVRRRPCVYRWPLRWMPGGPCEALFFTWAPGLRMQPKTEDVVVGAEAY